MKDIVKIGLKSSGEAIKKKTAWTKSKGNVFVDVGFSTIEARKLQLRSSMSLLLSKYIQNEGLTQAAAAKKLRVSQPRISNLQSGRVDLFSTGMLLAMLERAGFHVYEKIDKILWQAA